MTMPLQSRISTAAAALDKALEFLQEDGTFDGETSRGTDFLVDLILFEDNSYTGPYLFGELAEFDRITNQTMYQDVIKNSYPRGLRVVQADANLGFRTDIMLLFGRSAAIAYAAYNDSFFLDYATSLWAFGNNYTLSDSDFDGQSDKRSFPLQQDCRGASMSGGTLCRTDKDDPCITSLASGLFLTLSSLLFSATGDDTYLSAAQRSANWISTQTKNDQGLLFEDMSVRQNDTCTPLQDTFIRASDIGLLIEGLSGLVSFSGDSSTKQILRDSVAAAVTNGTVWQNTDNGVITDGGQSTRGAPYLIRALSVAYSLKPTDSESLTDMQDYIEDYVAVQYNAMLDQATSSGSNIYRQDWQGPPTGKFVSGSQTGALQVLIDGILLGTDSGAGTSSTSSPSPPASKSSAPPVGAIVGGVIGGVVFVATGLGLAFFLVRRWRQNKLRYPSGITPFETATQGQQFATSLPCSGKRGVMNGRQTTNQTTVSFPPTQKGLPCSRANQEQPAPEVRPTTVVQAPIQELDITDLARVVYQMLHPQPRSENDDPPAYYQSGRGA
ncbi:hypothetical protein D9758_003701 [Tetrapyrgos nigripes]|uniref:Glycoside hydrolase family 76 protein n=1 Tax=Tetrapyrgos nigripes TaxID=182062 RepID=A0A8H5LS77_9AGAR|nr:hypothetical protein D9758_003701 [Tetrapyrgos nigripes]